MESFRVPNIQEGLQRSNITRGNDAESLDAPFSHKYQDAIRTYHVGFVRDKRKMVQAKMYMQKYVFNLGYFDPRFQHDLDHNDGKFDPYTRFSKDDLLPIFRTIT